MDKNNVPKLIVAITGASGAVYGIRLLEVLREAKIETHLIISKSANITITTETDRKLKDIIALADYNYNQSDIAACISSGSFKTTGMIIAPCSVKTLAAIACGYDDNLISRAAGVIIKEQRRLALMVRETPFSPIHLENMLKLAKIGVSICPPVPAFYNRPISIDDLVNHSIARVLDLFNLDSDITKRWSGLQ
jgi:4-hydroxy-3-polyprenylbenzoate decarboxylase